MQRILVALLLVGSALAVAAPTASSACVVNQIACANGGVNGNCGFAVTEFNGNNLLVAYVCVTEGTDENGNPCYSVNTLTTGTGANQIVNTCA